MLLQNLLAHFAQRQAIPRRIKPFQPPGHLHRLKCHAAHAFLLECEVDDLADFPVVQAFFQRDDERRGDVVLVEAIERLATDVAQVFTTKLAKDGMINLPRVLRGCTDASACAEVVRL